MVHSTENGFWHDEVNLLRFPKGSIRVRQNIKISGRHRGRLHATDSLKKYGKSQSLDGARCAPLHLR